MCFAAAGPILSFAASAVGGLMQYRAQQAHAAAQNAAWEQNQRAALVAKRDTEQALTLRQMQEAGATKQAIRQGLIDKERRQAAALVSGVASGRSGITLDALINDIGRASEENRATLLTNWESVAAQLQRQKEAEGTYMRQVNSVGTAEYPSPLSPVLSVAGAGLRLYGDLTKDREAA